MERKNNTSFLIHDFMVDELKLSGVALSVYALIYSFTKAGADCHGSINYICEKVGASYKSVYLALKTLLEKNYIIKLSNNINSPNRYRANIQNDIPPLSKLHTPYVKTADNNKDNNKDDNTTTNHSFIQGERSERLNYIGTKKLVLMSYHQFTNLLRGVGVSQTLRYMHVLEDLITRHPGILYKNHYQIILKWAREDHAVVDEEIFL